MLRLRLRNVNYPKKLFCDKFFHSSSVRCDKVAPIEEPVNVLDELRQPELTEEELMEKRCKSRLPYRIYKEFVEKEPLPLEAKYNFSKPRLRKYYARFGKNSLLNPGICWPTKEELRETIHYDKTFEPPLSEKIAKLEAIKAEENAKRKAVEDEVDKNMARLDKWIADFHERNAKKEEKTRLLRQEREKLVEEISEYLGYDIDPRDPRFKEAVEQRDKEKKKAMKAKKQQESYDKMLEKLKKIAQSK